MLDLGGGFVVVLLRKLFYFMPGDHEAACLAIDLAQLSLYGDHVLKAGRNRWALHLALSCSGDRRK